MTWNRTRQRNSLGAKHQQPREQSAWIEIPAPELRIVSDAVWAAAQRRRQERTISTPAGRSLGKSTGRLPKYPLSGLLVCTCGGRYEAVRYGDERVVYVCSTRRRKGPAVCSNGVRIPASPMDAAVIDALECHAL